jgi:hypothetical protein
MNDREPKISKAGQLISNLLFNKHSPLFSSCYSRTSWSFLIPDLLTFPNSSVFQPTKMNDREPKISKSGRLLFNLLFNKHSPLFSSCYPRTSWSFLIPDVHTLTNFRVFQPTKMNDREPKISKSGKQNPLRLDGQLFFPHPLKDHTS